MNTGEDMEKMRRLGEESENLHKRGGNVMEERGLCYMNKMQKGRGGLEKVSYCRRGSIRAHRGEFLRGRKEGCCERENSFPSNPQEDSRRCQKYLVRH